jgi:hypothetical protein
MRFEASVALDRPASEIEPVLLSGLGPGVAVDGDRLQVEVDAATRPEAAASITRLLDEIGLKVARISFGAYRNPYDRSDSRHTYCVIFRAYSAVRLGLERVLNFNFVDDDDDKPSAIASFLSTDERTSVDNSPTVFLWARIVVNAPSIEEGIQEAFPIADGLVGIVSLAANAAVGKMEFERSYDICDAHDDHDYLQLTNYRPPLAYAYRNVSAPDSVAKLLEQIFSSHEQSRIYRAVQQYRLALDHAEPGDELLCLAHAWMGYEALTSAFRRREEAKVGSRDALCELWAIEVRQLDSEVRRRSVVKDDEIFLAARAVSDAFEHGFREFGVLWRSSREIALRALARLREAIFEAADVDPALSDELKQVELAEPIGLIHTGLELRTTLRGPADDLCAEGVPFPLIAVEGDFSASPSLDTRTVEHTAQYRFEFVSSDAATFDTDMLVRYIDPGAKNVVYGRMEMSGEDTDRSAPSPSDGP